MKSFYGDLRHHARLIEIITHRLGHALIARAEAAKIAVAEGADTVIDLAVLERGLVVAMRESDAAAAIHGDLERIGGAANQTIVQAGIAADRVDALYFTGGSTGLKPLADRIAAQFQNARVVRGNRFSSVVQGLGLHAQRIFS